MKTTIKQLVSIGYTIEEAKCKVNKPLNYEDQDLVASLIDQEFKVNGEVVTVAYADDDEGTIATVWINDEIICQERCDFVKSGSIPNELVLNDISIVISDELVLIVTGNGKYEYNRETSLPTRRYYKGRNSKMIWEETTDGFFKTMEVGGRSFIYKGDGLYVSRYDDDKQVKITYKPNQIREYVFKLDDDEERIVIYKGQAIYDMVPRLGRGEHI